MTIIWGILCLGLIILIHETGHFTACKLCGVEVESFSLGMGPVVLHKKIGKTDFRLSLIPLGGYCGMKGDKAFQKALEEKLSSIPKEANSFYGVHPLKRMLIAFAGPFFNVIFAFISFTIIAMIGYNYYSASNKIIIADEIYPEITSSARKAGMETGDKIISLNGNQIATYSDISEYVSVHPGENVEAVVERNGQQLMFTVIPELDKSTGAGKIGILNWIEPIVSAVTAGGIADKAGIEAGDKIIEVDGEPIENIAYLQKSIQDKTSCSFTILKTNKDNKLNVDGALDGALIKNISITLPQDGANLGMQFSVPEIKVSPYSFFPACIKGFNETWNMFTVTLKSLKLFFSGIDFSSAVSGPVRITVLLGDTVKYGFGQGFSTGITSVLNLLALISISLFIMNLLPIPILDGGLVLFAFIEAVSGKQVKPKLLYLFQIIGIVIIALLFGLALFSDLKYLISK